MFDVGHAICKIFFKLLNSLLVNHFTVMVRPIDKRTSIINILSAMQEIRDLVVALILLITHM